MIARNLLLQVNHSGRNGMDEFTAGWRDRMARNLSQGLLKDEHPGAWSSTVNEKTWLRQPLHPEGTSLAFSLRSKSRYAARILDKNLINSYLYKKTQQMLNAMVAFAGFYLRVCRAYE